MAVTLYGIVTPVTTVYDDLFTMSDTLSTPDIASITYDLAPTAETFTYNYDADFTDSTPTVTIV